ncbi:hypothetical protein DH2020_027108 [Rehmannia glutinosa]|uniref:Mitochondrial import inner membrane translocase subunit TIM50 n=1 Tax=Rehmannia glutinosa TaxID=99300 RepID=A0ABR0VZ92_REHGL
MQTRQRATGRNSRELASPRVSRQQKNLVQNVQVQAKKVTELITSSARKKKVVDNIFGSLLQLSVGTISKAIEEPDHDNGDTNCGTDTIFSPSFHIARSVGEFSSEAEFYNFFQHGNQQFQDCGKENIQIDCPGGVALSPEVSAIYLSMKNSNLECIDENNQDHMSADVCQEDEDAEEYDDFDPYFFIKNLPDLSSVVPTFRPLLLPKQTRSCPSTTLVLDLDETLVHSTLEPCEDADFTFSVNFNLKEHTSKHLCGTTSKCPGPKEENIRHRVYRDSCVLVDGNYLKDLSVLGRDLARVIIIDNSPQAFGFQVDNGIPIESWFDDRSDTELLLLLPFWKV